MLYVCFQKPFSGLILVNTSITICFGQMKMHQCSVQCCANETYKAEDVQRCCERCAEGPTQVQHYMQQELESFQVEFVF